MTPRARRTLLALLLPALALTACGGSGEEDSGGSSVAAAGPPDAQTATVVGNARLEFEPTTVTAKPGKLALTMTIEGAVPHNLVFDEDTIGEDIEQISEGSATSTFAFPQPGTYDFVCTLHPGMDGKVVVS